jgi:hypothetical protein
LLDCHFHFFHVQWIILNYNNPNFSHISSAFFD